MKNRLVSEPVGPGELRQARLLLGLRQIDLSHSLGIASETVSRMESGAIEANALKRKAIASLLYERAMGLDGMGTNGGMRRMVREEATIRAA